LLAGPPRRAWPNEIFPRWAGFSTDALHGPAVSGHLEMAANLICFTAQSRRFGPINFRKATRPADNQIRLRMKPKNGRR
jgi:hypothetical protein